MIKPAVEVSQYGACHRFESRHSLPGEERRGKGSVLQNEDFRRFSSVFRCGVSMLRSRNETCVHVPILRRSAIQRMLLLSRVEALRLLPLAVAVEAPG
jgi:hypothetical protein